MIKNKTKLRLIVFQRTKNVLSLSGVQDQYMNVTLCGTLVCQQKKNEAELKNKISSKEKN